MSSLLDGVDAAARRAPVAPWLGEFTPRRFLRNGHLQTLVGNFLRRDCRLPEPEARVVEVESAGGARTERSASPLPASHVLCHCHWQPREVRRERLTVLLLHGLQGSSYSRYILGNAARLWAAGCNVVRMNMRNCGGTEHLSPTLYHSGLSGDVGAVICALTAEHGLEHWGLVGYSMGGNLVLKYAGECGRHSPAPLNAVVGVSPVIDLAESADALHEPANRIYEWKFLRGLCRRYERKAALFPQIYEAGRSRGVRSIREFDDRVMAPYSGFSGADDYYDRAASARVIGEIAAPTLVLHALDDPFIRITPDSRARLLGNSYVTTVETENGGHCAFLDARTEEHDGHWAEKALAGFLMHAAGLERGS